VTVEGIPIALFVEVNECLRDTVLGIPGSVTAAKPLLAAG
jgi:hypothetical protein